MTRAEFNAWIEEHYDELVAVAFLRTRRGSKRGHDTGQGEARDAVQGAVARALDSPVLAALEPAKAWPWMVDAVRSVVYTDRRSAKRASKTHRQWAGAFLIDSGLSRGRQVNPSSMTVEQCNPLRSDPSKGGRLVATDPYQNDDENGHDFIGPRGDWRGEYTVAHLGKCPCSGEMWSRLEVGRDVERLGYSKRWAVEALMAIQHAVKDTPPSSIYRLAGYALGCVAADAASRRVHRIFQVLGCWNGHRTYTGEMP